MKSFEDFVVNVEKYIEYYNEQRTHKTLKIKHLVRLKKNLESPVEYIKGKI